MKTDSLLGVLTGTAHNNISITGPFETGTTLGTYTIPEIPCSGTFRIEETFKRKAENKLGECGEADSDFLELLSDEILLYVSKGEGAKREGSYNVQVDDKCP